jgi:hypothetical protein
MAFTPPAWFCRARTRRRSSWPETSRQFWTHSAQRLGRTHIPAGVFEREEEEDKKDVSVGDVGAVDEDGGDGDGDGEERRSNSFEPRVPEGGEESARAVRCGRPWRARIKGKSAGPSMLHARRSKCRSSGKRNSYGEVGEGADSRESQCVVSSLLGSICIERRWSDGKESESRRSEVLVVSRKLKARDVRSGMVVNVGFGWKMGSVPSKRKMAL